MKKRVEICGTIEVPLEKGCAAFIRKVGEEPFRTSTVKHFITMPSGLTYIQTEIPITTCIRPPESLLQRGVGYET